MFWGWVLGPLGAMLAIPLTLLVKAVLVDSDPHADWAGALLSSKTSISSATGPSHERRHGQVFKIRRPKKLGQRSARRAAQIDQPNGTNIQQTH